MVSMYLVHCTNSVVLISSTDSLLLDSDESGAHTTPSKWLSPHLKNRLKTLLTCVR